MESFFRITDSDDILLFDCRLSNDKAEIQQGLNIIRDSLNPKESSLIRDREYDKAQAINALRKHIFQPRFDAFVACFSGYPNESTEPNVQDQLGQWRGYGADGRGVCISFEKTLFYKNTQPMLLVSPVSYDTEVQKKIVMLAIEYWEHLISHKTEEFSAEKTAELLSTFIPLFKHPAFSEENEWRIVFTPSQCEYNNIKFFEKNGVKIPYFKLKDIAAVFKGVPLPINEVMIGPSVDQDSLYESVWHWMKQSRPECKISKSAIPYRGRS